MIRAGVIGATGYTGMELVKLLERHPEAEVGWLTSETYAGRQLGDVFALPQPIGALPLAPLAEADYSAVDLVFCCLPHAAAQSPVANALATGKKAIDLSADFRLRDAAEYQRWYGVVHGYQELLAEAAYGLPELHRQEIAAARLVANPGCYPTSVILGLAPLAQAGWLEGTIIADSKSGVSGAGRQPSLKTHFVEASQNFSPYNIGRVHRHLPEMEQELREQDAHVDGEAGWSLIFSPHLIPVNRGILSTLYVNLPAGIDETGVRQQYVDLYGGEPFVHVLPPGQVATLAHTVGSNDCAIGLTPVPGTRTLIVTASIDNLVKGASGQAVQNMNVMFGLDETTGLR